MHRLRDVLVCAICVTNLRETVAPPRDLHFCAHVMAPFPAVGGFILPFLRTGIPVMRLGSVSKEFDLRGLNATALYAKHKSRHISIIAESGYLVVGETPRARMML